LEIGSQSKTETSEETEVQQWKSFYAPTLKLKVVCHKCRACIHACPVKALKWGVGEIEVDLKKCAEEWLEKGECIQCAAECHQGAILLEQYRIRGNEIEKV
jgi:Fe-S-cluster-containing hydrogenase component 2